MPSVSEGHDRDHVAGAAVAAVELVQAAPRPDLHQAGEELLHHPVRHPVTAIVHNALPGQPHRDPSRNQEWKRRPKDSMA
jgi:hypothetical protein